MRVSANLTMLFTDVPLASRYEKAAAAGFKLVEIALPYSEPAEVLHENALKHGLKHSLINAPTGDWAAGFRGLAALTKHRNEFQESIDKALEYARKLNCTRIHVMAGLASSEDSEAQKCYLENIEFAAKKLAENNITCLIEPINNYTVKGYFLNSYEHAKEVLDRVNMPNLKIQYDLFHAQQIKGQITATFDSYKDDIGYLQVAQVPHRLSPGFAGEIDYRYVFETANKINPDWIIGCEYNQSKENSEKDFNWIETMGLKF